MAFQGMNPEEGRDVAQVITDAGQQILDLFEGVTSLVNSVEWVGPDYEGYREDWNSFQTGVIGELANLMQEKGTRLGEHAEEQDTTSNQGA